MDQVKIGKFIAECRKSKGMTQMQLAEKLNITDRAISKWETGKTLPDSSIMLELCEILGITVNDLLNGEKVSSENYAQKLEAQLLNAIQEKERLFQYHRRINLIYAACCLLFALAIMFLEDVELIVSCLMGMLVLTRVFNHLLGNWMLKNMVFVQCQICGCTRRPHLFKDCHHKNFLSRDRKYLRCPCCKQRTWHDKRFTPISKTPE